ncbi:hypothetical protein ACFVMC_00250 [Nocardia sp. NPDC127579]|uniref:hypothetical protein n=1 Tax=Nocardia sp. NPDC127579 TaxID=3345402 RepID=UPI00362FB9B2
MTLISEPVASIASADNNTVFGFQSILDRENAAGTGMVTAALVTTQAIDGVLQIALDPGETIVNVGSRRYLITVPDSAIPIRLWPLIQAGLPVPPAQEAAAVRNGGGVRRIAVAELDDYLAMPSPDPETVYIVPE